MGAVAIQCRCNGLVVCPSLDAMPKRIRWSFLLDAPMRWLSRAAARYCLTQDQAAALIGLDQAAALTQDQAAATTFTEDWPVVHASGRKAFSYLSAKKAQYIRPIQRLL